MTAGYHPMIEEWRRSVIPPTERVEATPEEEFPFGAPAESLGYLEDVRGFETRVFGRAPLENLVIKQRGSEIATLPEGYEHLKEGIDRVFADQLKKNPLFRHAEIHVTHRQNTYQIEVTGQNNHADSNRTEGSVIDDYIYFMANRQGPFVQIEYVSNPDELFERKTPDTMAEAGLMRQAKDGEIIAGRSRTFHAQGALIYQIGRTLLRAIVTHPPASYFHSLPDHEKAMLPEEFRDKHGITFDQPILEPG
ncbi:MAG: hypothetical protein H6856_07870 [Rhodospirillales bacterium]|nr:hypothetical protein [Rhodospirillales bacterium]